MLKQTQSQKLSQKVLPQIIQRQSLLAVPSLAIEQMIKKELEENPLLEESEELDEAVDEKDDKKADDDLDFGDHYNEEYDGYKTHEFKKSKEHFNYENMWRDTVTLQDNLISQLHVATLTDKQIYIGEFIIGNLDEDGYLRIDLNSIKNELEEQSKGTSFDGEKFDLKELQDVLYVIQRLEPIGLGCKDLRDCLLVQAGEMDIDEKMKEYVRILIKDYFEDLRLKKYEKIMKGLGIDKDTLNNVFETVQKLNPKPGYVDDLLEQNYIYPDLIVTKINEEYKVFLNDKIPSLKVNHAYREMMNSKKSGINAEAKDYIKNNFERAKWYIDAINSRRETMMKVMNSILIRQFDFFESLGEGLKPMYEKDVADDIHMDISTISRTVRGKYVQTDFGIYELKYFFSNFMTNDEGDDISTKEIKKTLKEIIGSEDTQKPFTDDQLTAEMEKVGFKIARRTVAKYRESMNIPKARLRRRI
jgi:RNA polymerase sigma-54 factor